MKEKNCGDRTYLQSELFLETNKVIHGFSGKCGGVSRGKICGLNLGFRVGDDPRDVKENYSIIARDLGFDLNKTVLSRQTHTDNIRIVTEEDCGKGITRQSDIYDTDGLVTDIKGIALIVFAADCTPILLFDPVCGVAAAVHSGWRGTIKGIGGKAVKLMCDTFGSAPENIIAAVGPCIGACCFEFDKPEAEKLFDAKYIIGSEKKDKVHIDIQSMNADILISCGITKNHIDKADMCTVCNSDKYYSYRAHGSNTGRQAAVISVI